MAVQVEVSRSPPCNYQVFYYYLLASALFVSTPKLARLAGRWQAGLVDCSPFRKAVTQPPVHIVKG